MKKIAFILTILSAVAGSSCSGGSAGTKHTVVSQTGSNRAFPSNGHARTKGKKYKNNRASVKSKQREHARFQGHQEATQ